MNPKLEPTIRSDIYDLYWLFAARRQQAFESRLSGAPGPWSTDPILRKYKFCNVFRAADRVSQYLIRNVAYNTYTDTPEDRLFQIVAFRTFSNPEAWNGIVARIGRTPTLKHLSSGEFETALDDIRRERGGLYTGAFILCATKAYGFNLKHQNHVALFKDMFLKQSAGKRILEAESLEKVVKILESFPLMGPFMSYQTAIDLNYSEYVNFDENNYTQAGPGALRGIKKAFISLNGMTPSEVILWMVERQSVEFSRLGLNFQGLFGRPLHAIDCQGLFCELDKYCREAAPEMLSNRTRIKAQFKPRIDPIEYFFPPKWRLRLNT